MTQRNMGLIVCLLLLNAAVGCGKATPEAKTSPSNGATPSTAATLSDSATTQASFKKIEGDGVELSVPADYEGGNPSKDLDALAQKLKAIDPKYEKALDQLKKNSFALLAFDLHDLQAVKSGKPTYVNISKQKASSTLSIEEALKRVTKQLPPPYEVLDQKLAPLERYQAGRIIAQAPTPNPQVKQLFYIIKNGDIFWVVTYISSADKFDQLLPTFEQSVRTFTAKS